MDQDKEVIKRAKDIIQFMLLTCNSDINIDYSAILVILAQLHYEDNDPNGDNIKSFVTDLDRFIGQRHREQIIMSN